MYKASTNIMGTGNRVRSGSRNRSNNAPGKGEPQRPQLSAAAAAAAAAARADGNDDSCSSGGDGNDSLDSGQHSPNETGGMPR